LLLNSTSLNQSLYLMNAMNNLKSLYAEREIFLKYNREVPSELLNEIKGAEKVLLENALDMFTGHLPDEVELPSFDNITFAAEYSEGKLVRVASSCKVDISQIFESVKSIDDEETEDSEADEDEINDDNSDSGRKRSSSIGFTVKFADGKIVKHTTARRTMIEALRYMGLERASKFRGEMFKGYPLIGKEQRPTEPRRTWQKNVDGWWIYVNMGNHRAISCLKGVAKLLDIELEIIMDGDDEAGSAYLRTTLAKSKGKRSLFSINGSEPLSKNRAVYESVCLFIQQFPDASFSDIEQMFPRSLQGSYGVVRTLEDIHNREEINKTESARWFLDPKEILTAADGTRFAVSNEWGNNFDDFKKHVETSFGWTVEEV